jgi:DNA-binding CsgD family transcriptional regulator
MEESPGSASVLLERDLEVAQLTALLGQARAGQGAVAAIEGPAGIGKTGLLSALRRLAADRGFQTLHARGRELESEMAFGVARQLLEPPLLAAAAPRSHRLLAGPARTGAGALGLPAGTTPASDFDALHGLYWLCVNLAGNAPLLLTVDDLQWADGPSLSWLGYFAVRAAELPVLLAVTVRTGDPRAGAPGVAGLLSDSAAHRLVLCPLSPEGVTALVRRQLGERAGARFCRTCSELAGGNPLFVRELLAAARGAQLAGGDEDAPRLREIAPAAVGASVHARLVRLTPDAIAMAEALAVLGSLNEVALVAELAGVDLATAELAADELAAAQLILPARPLDFAHPLIGEAVYTQVGVGARRLSHRRAAAILDRTGDADRAAVHLLATGPSGDAWVASRLAAAADSARGRGAPEVATRYLRRALAEPPPPAERAGLLLRLGNAEWYTGQPAAIGHLEEALAQASDVPATSSAAGTLANVYVVSDRIDAAVAVLRQASARTRAANPHRAASLEASAVLAGILDDRTAPWALDMVDRWRAELDGMADPPVRCLVAIAQVAMRRNQPAEAARLVGRVLAGQPYPPPADASTSTIVTLIGLEDFGTLQKLCDDTIADARKRAAVPGLVVAASFSAWAMVQRGDLADAEAQAQWALERASGIFEMDAVAHLAEILVERDELDAADAAVGRVPAPLDSHSIMVVTYQMARGRLRAAQGRHAEALADFLVAGERCGLLGIVMAVYDWRSEAALCHAFLGQQDEARALARAETEIARAAGLPRALGVALRARGLVEGGDAGLGLLAESVSVLEASQARVELARALADYGAALRRAGHRADARAFLERALDLAYHCGARRIAAQAREELVAAGAKPRREAFTGRDALTASELRVARLAAAGQANREIAQSLFITTKTASAHLSRVYRKLGVTRRSQLADALSASLS